MKIQHMLALLIVGALIGFTLHPMACVQWGDSVQNCFWWKE